MAKISPLHKVIDDGRWAAERLLGRLIILAHAAFLDAGFVAAADAAADQENSVRLPSEVGRTAAALPLRYAAPQLLHRPDAAAAAVALKLRVHGRRHLVFYVRVDGLADLWVAEEDAYCFCVDALAAARLLAGGLDATARALRRDPALGALWGALTDGLVRRALADLCARSGVPLGRTLLSLPTDAMAAILSRLEDGEDLMVVECTCTALRRLVAELDAVLWKPMYEDVVDARRFAGVVRADDESPEMSWKERFTAAIHRPIPINIGPHAATVNLAWLLDLEAAIVEMWHNDHVPVPPQHPVVPLSDDDRSDSPELPPESVPRRRRRQWRAMPRDFSHGRALVHGGHNNQRRGGAGAVHSPSSRYRWSRR
ncbi:uncharacterized protein [Oryza sativa Japonica Group]|nr:hypothetical protein DAI22_02g120200 [Oryza sativa Japonica Group]USI00757.1 F-box domain-containing protein [Oryza sativa Japonica Group]BAD28281.1 hypothetical protein [Oryza sativa Japonica Group]